MNNIFNIRVGKQPWFGQTGEKKGVAMAWMETATKVTADDIEKVMKKYNIFIV